MDNYAPHFSKAELIFSQTATRLSIDNSLPKELEENLISLSWKLEELRGYIGMPIFVSSGYRCPELNKAIGGSKTSDHMNACAADIVVHSLGSFDLSNVAAKRLNNYDQIINEFGRWVHVGLGNRKRGQLLTATKENGQTVYKVGIIEV